FSGTTILGDGSVILIVDPSGVAQGIGDLDLSHRAAPDETAQDDAATESLLVFRAGSPNPMAVPISLVTRLEEVDAATIEMTSSGPLVQYRGHLMPLVPVNSNVRVRQSGTQPLLVFSDERRTMGLLVDEIVDIVEDRLEIEVTGSEPGLVGSAVIKGQA